VVVLLSRTRRGEQTIFWCPNPQGGTDKEAAIEMVEAFFETLIRTSPFRNHLMQIINSYCANARASEPNIINQSTSTYRMKYIYLPTDMSGHVYIIVSTVNLPVFYIGSTRNIVMRLERHNQGSGGQQSSNPRYRPSGLLAFISGFGGSKEKYTDFEQAWI